jgi:hypothetical protein
MRDNQVYPGIGAEDRYRRARDETMRCTATTMRQAKRQEKSEHGTRYTVHLLEERESIEFASAAVSFRSHHAATTISVHISSSSP